MANEKRLIDANALIATLEKIAKEDRMDCFYLDEITQEIFDAPTVDAVEVVHGYTVPAEQPKKVLLDKKCVICDSLMLSTDAYCPSCGAKMDGDGNA